MTAEVNMVRPDVKGTSHGRASHLCGQQQPGYNWRQRDNPFLDTYYNIITSEMHVYAFPFAYLSSNRNRQDSLSVSFQLADLKEDHEIVFGVTGSRSGASQSVELGGRHWMNEEDADSFICC